ncbi:hypothetical protein DRQ00_11020 [candidate division KSB1 bacterium]|nr:MAG: hypothetical protein DRQ00_11020 [candidate division KSB1 bacterium]
MIRQFILFSSCIYGFLLIGYFSKRKRWIETEKSTTLMKGSIFFLEPVIIVSTFWALDISDLRILSLPLTASLLSLFILLPAQLFSKLHHHIPKDKGAYFGGSMFSNIGLSLGGFLCFLLLGEQGLGLAFAYMAYFIPFFFSIGFYIARRISLSAETKGNVRSLTWRENLKASLQDPLGIVPTVAILVGLAFNFSGLERFQILSTINKILVPLSVAVYSFAIGLTMKFRKLREYLPECLTMSIIKFLISPIVGVGFAYILGCSDFMGGLALKVVLIEATMPAAIFSLILARLFNLNQDLANSCWLFTTFAVIFVVPILSFVLRLF